MGHAEPPLLGDHHLATLRGLQRRLIGHIANGRSTDLAERPMRRPASIYSDPRRLGRERERIFLEQPLVAGLSGDIPDPGDTLVFNGTGRPLIVVRDAQGNVHAFLNMCTHRASALVSADGCHRSFTCPFHGWTFDLDGSLIGLPGRIAFDGIDLDALKLRRVPCAEWNGLIFVRGNPDGAPIDVAAHLGGFARELEELKLQRYGRARSGVMKAEGNWKYVLETFGEGYHFASLHPTSLAQTHYTNVAVFDAFGPHHRISFAPKSYKDLLDVPEDRWPLPDSVLYMIFPNTAMLVGSPMPGHHFVQLFRIYPSGVAETDALFTLYAPKEQLDGDGRAIAETGFDFARQIIETEDFSVARAAQRNLANAPEDSLVTYGRNEIALQHLHRHLDALLDAS